MGFWACIRCAFPAVGALRAAAFSSSFLTGRARAARQTRLARGSAPPVETHVPRLPARPPGSGRPVARFFVRWYCPRPPNLRLRCDAHLSWAPRRAPSSSPAVARTHTRMRRSTAACGASRAGFLLSRTPRTRPCLASCTPRSLRRAVWRTHTHSGLPRARGRGRDGFHGRNGTRVARAFPPSRHPLTMPTHAASQLHMAHTLRRTWPPPTPPGWAVFTSSAASGPFDDDEEEE